MEPDENPFLRAFYDGESGAGFQAQFAFLIRRFEQLHSLDLGPRSQRTIISDFIFEKDKLFACLNLSDVELETYNRYYNYFREQLPTPDLVIYLQATPEVLKKRLRRKNAPGEKARSEEHTSELQSLAYLVCRLLLEKKKKRLTLHNKSTDNNNTTI